MSEQSATSSHEPLSAESTSRGEADWTTGQGIGFLVSLPGWTAVGLAIVAFVVSAAGTTTSEIGDASLFVVGLALGLGGLVCAIPGTIVFNKCKRR